MFHTLMSKKQRIPTKSGNRFADQFTLVTERDGNTHLEKVGEIDTFDVINSYADECDLHNIVRRYESGDVNALNRAQGVFADTTQLPNDLHTANKLLRNAELVYNALDGDLKAKFGGFDGFIQQFKTVESINSFITSLTPSKTPDENSNTTPMKKDGDESES